MPVVGGVEGHGKRLEGRSTECGCADERMVDGALGYRSGTGPVDHHLIASDGDVHLYGVGLAQLDAVMVDLPLSSVAAVGDGADLAPHARLGEREDFEHGLLYDLGTVALAERGVASRPRFTGRDLGIKVALDQLREADVPQDKAQQLLVKHASAIELIVGEDHPFLVKADRVGAPATGGDTTDIRPVRHHGREGDQLALEEDGQIEHGVTDVGPGVVRLVAEQDVPLGKAYPLDAALDGGW